MISWMYETALIFRREVGARRHLLLAGLALSALTLLLPLLPTISSLHGGDVRDLLSIVFAAGAGVVLSIGLGATLIGSDLSEGRLGFFFERPVFSASIWLGRFLAALFIVVIAEILVLAPASLSPFHGLDIVEFLGADWSITTTDWVIAFLAGPAVILLGSHCVSIMLRARTAWLVLDLLGFTLVGPAIWLIYRPLVAQGAEDAATVVGAVLAVSVSVAMLSATATSVSCGRTDLRRAHRFLSVTLWGFLSVCLIATASYSSWLLRFTPEEFDSYQVMVTSADGRWAEVQGRRRGHLDVRLRFLVSSDGISQIPLPSSGGWWGLTRFSSSGNRAVWRGRGVGQFPRTLWYVDLESDKVEPVETNITVSGYGRCLLSPDGSRVAVLERQIVSVYELAGGRLIATQRAPEDSYSSIIRFTSGENIRYVVIEGDDVPRPDTSWSIRVSDIAVEPNGEVTHYQDVPVGHDRSVRFDPDLRFIVTGFERSADVTAAVYLPKKVFDSVTGEYKMTVEGSFRGFLRDGRIWSTRRAESGELRVIFQTIDDDDPAEHNLGYFPGGVRAYELFSGNLAIVSDVEFEKQGPGHFPWDRVEIFEIESGSRRLIGERLFLDGRGGRESSCSFNFYYGLSAGYSDKLLFRNEQGVLLGWDSNANRLNAIAGSGRK